MQKIGYYIVSGFLALFVAMVIVAATVEVHADALATPPQSILNWEWTNASGNVLGQVTTSNPTPTTIFQNGNTSQPGSFPSQSVIVSNDGTTGTPDIYFTLSATQPVTPDAANNGNGTPTRHVKAGDPPLGIDGRYKYFWIIRGTEGNNANQDARLTVIY